MQKEKLKILFGEHFIVWFTIGFFIYMSATTPAFRSFFNINNIFLDIARIGIMSIGMTYVIITAGIDLSIASNLALTAMVGGILMRATDSVLFSFLVMLLIGISIGAFNGLLVSKLKMVPFIVTLGMSSLARGLAMLTTLGRTIYGFPPIVSTIGTGDFYGIPIAGFLTISLFVVAWYGLNRTVFGRSVYLVGNNHRAARLSGVNVDRVRISVYILSGLCGALAGFIQLGRLDSARPNVALGLELDVITSVILGGTSLFGGKGTMLGTLCGVFIIVLIRNTMAMLGVSVYYHQIVKGIVIFVAVFIDIVRSGRLSRKVVV